MAKKKGGWDRIATKLQEHEPTLPDVYDPRRAPSFGSIYSVRHSPEFMRKNIKKIQAYNAALGHDSRKKPIQISEMEEDLDLSLDD
jgi:hypothetical protein